MKDWKTTTAGVLTIVVGAITFVALPLLQGHAPNVNGFLATLTPGLGLVMASDSAGSK